MEDQEYSIIAQREFGANTGLILTTAVFQSYIRVNFDDSSRVAACLDEYTS